VRLTVPILESGLERAVALAESMDARGFARIDRGPTDRWAGWCALASLVALGGSFVALVGRSSGTALALGGAGVVLLLASVSLSSRSVRTSRYRPRSITRLDVGVGAVALSAPLALAVLDATTDVALFWTPYPLAFPPFAMAPALVIALLAVPVLVPPLPAEETVAR
jgi:energy-coupling factor transport system permease protein